MGSRVMFALDVSTWDDALSKAEEATGNVWGFKVKPDLFFENISRMHELKKLGRIMVDPKLADTPEMNTALLAKMVNAGADIVTVHASFKYSPPEELRKYVAGVTVLTSMDSISCQDVYTLARSEMVGKFATFAVDLGYEYLVCSAMDIVSLPIGTFDIKKLCPAIRPQWSIVNNDDQADENKATPRYAIRNNAYVVIVGRPILKSPDIRTAILQTNEEIRQTIESPLEWVVRYKFDD